MSSPTFNPNDHLVKLKGKDYLPVAARIVWFRSEHPDWAVVAAPIVPLEVSLQNKYAVFQATIMDATGRVIATGTKSENVAGFGDYIEKAETGAIGRALANCGYGTQFAPEFDEGSDRIADTPQTPRNQPTQGRDTQSATSMPPRQNPPQTDNASFDENNEEQVLIDARNRFRATAAKCGKPCLNVPEEARLLNRLLNRTGVAAKQPPTFEEYRDAARAAVAERKAEIERERTAAEANNAEGGLDDGS